jgi:hypothetical protein
MADRSAYRPPLFCRPFTGATVDYFGRTKFEEARQWVAAELPSEATRDDVVRPRRSPLGTFDDINDEGSTLIAID